MVLGEKFSGAWPLSNLQSNGVRLYPRQLERGLGEGMCGGVWGWVGGAVCLKMPAQGLPWWSRG